MAKQLNFDTKEASRRFIEVRTKAGLTQEELANKLGVALQTIKNYEKAGSANVKENSSNDRTSAIAGMKTETLFKIAKQFGVSADWLLGISDTTSQDQSVKSMIDKLGLSERNIVMLCAAQSAIDTARSNTDDEFVCKFQEQFMERFDFLSDLGPRIVGFYFTLLVNDLISAALADQEMLLNYSALLGAVSRSSAFPEDVNHQILENQAASSMISIPTWEYVRYLSDKIGQYIGGYVGTKYEYALNSKYADNGDTSICD